MVGNCYICTVFYIIDVRSPEINKDSGVTGLGDGLKGENDKPNRLMSLEKQLNIENKVCSSFIIENCLF